MKMKCFLSCFLAVLSLCSGAAEVVKDSFSVVLDRKFKPEDAAAVSKTGNLPGKKVKFTMTERMTVDLRTLFKNTVPIKDRAIILFKINSEKDQERYLWLWADYWYTCYVNGKFVASTEPAGEFAFLHDYYRTPRKISLKKGENFVAIHTRPGRASWKIVCRLMPERKDWYLEIVGPMVTHISRTSAVVLFYSELTQAYDFSYWKKGKKNEAKKIPARYVYGRIPMKNLFRHELSGLEPDTEYEYEFRNVDPDGISEHGSFRTAPATGVEHTFAAISDTQTGYEERESLIRQLVKMGLFKDIDMLVSLGDVANGLDYFIWTYFDSYITPFREEGVTAPFYPVRGNHEYRGLDTTPYTEFFGCPYYSFRYGDVFYIVLDTGEDKARRKYGHKYMLMTDTSEFFKQQKAWLENVIKTKDCREAKYRIVLAHAPPFEWEKPYYSKQIYDFAACLMGKDPECKIDLWLCGDIHAPYRFDPVTGEMVGAERKATKRKPCKLTATDAKNIHFPIYVNDGPGGPGQAYSVTRVQVRKDSLLITCTGVDGTVMDQVVIRKGKPFEVLKTTWKKYIPYNGK